MASVAAAADLTQPGLLHHFPSKEALLRELLEQRYHDDGRRLREWLARDDRGLVAALERLVEHNLSSQESARLFTVIVAEALSADHPAHAYFVERYEKIRHRLATTLRDDEQAGRLPPNRDADALAGLIVAVMDGLQTQWLLDPRFDMVRAFRAFTDLLADGPDQQSGATAAVAADGSDRPDSPG
jgi:AcrR family transcriptional regulator